ncbi:hypothetical protein E2562_031676 [Oryza meyeriana var. granulata]|uniref:Uncharacterized protein n=1 Tax=Oryza meyeriana var. granulata TaxID=110450 RepID=A0A6G1E5I4_9ORYZ|nr:hypothetical protein E2562_031676 [Oryza meyeriana var. granulata]
MAPARPAPNGSSRFTTYDTTAVESWNTTIAGPSPSHHVPQVVAEPLAAADGRVHECNRRAELAARFEPLKLDLTAGRHKRPIINGKQ